MKKLLAILVGAITTTAAEKGSRGEEVEKEKNIASTTAAEATAITPTLTATATATNNLLYYKPP
jgi:cytidine deaminase